MPRVWMIGALLTLAVAPAVAQTPSEPMSALEIALACAPPPRLALKPLAGLQVAGGQDTTPRTVFGVPETIVVDGGTAKGVAVGQRYFVRRTVYEVPDSGQYGAQMAPPSNSKQLGHLSHTVGWVRIAAANQTTALATIEHSCGVIAAGDILEPFTAPAVPATLSTQAPLGELDFSAPAHVLFGDEERISAGIGEFVVAARASAATAPGTRFAIYRDLVTRSVPLTSVGEAVVVSEGPEVAVLRIVRARDAVYTGDYLIPEKK